MSKHWWLGYDGPSLPMMVSPSGALYRLQVMGSDGWANDVQECQVQAIINVLNEESRTPDLWGVRFDFGGGWCSVNPHNTFGTKAAADKYVTDMIEFHRNMGRHCVGESVPMYGRPKE